VSSFRYGVSLYSYTDDFGTVMTLDDAFDHVADTGSTGIEILGETSIPLYPEPPAAWLDHWFAQLDRYKLEPTNLACWVDTRIQLDRNMTVAEGTAQIAQDLRLAHQLGFRFIRPKFGVIDEELTPDPIWEGAVERNLDLAHQLDLVILPGGFSYGDYLRSGAMAARSPILDAVRRFAQRGGRVLGVCNGFQILTEAGLLPGALMRNRDLRFICRTVGLRVETTNSPFTARYAPGAVLEIPVAHHDGNFSADDETLARLEGEDQVAFRYCDAHERVDETTNPNGSRANIAGIVSDNRRVLGLMPHPENLVEPALGGTDGRALFESLLEALP